MALTAIWMDLEIIMLCEVSKTPMSFAITYLWNLKKGYNELLCRINTNSQPLNNLWFPKQAGLRVGWMGWGFGDGNAIKLGCDDHCTSIKVIKFIALKKDSFDSVEDAREGSGT